ncbi:MAG: extracellular solute-binding protein [Chloroflexota bacterium]|nr:extracellular solute-binding protein [Chloroflexota bacterium]
MRGQRSMASAAAMCALALVVGCAQSGNGQTSTAGQTVKLVYFNARGGEASERKLVEWYQRDHPGIEIEYQASTAMQAPSDTDAISNLIFNVQAGIEVDVSKVEVTRTPLALLPAHAAIELTSIGGQAVVDRLSHLLNNNLAQVKGGIWSLPYEYDPFGYVYNADMFRASGLNPDQPPKTWDDLRTAARAIKTTFPDTWPICHPINNLSKIQPYVWGAGGTYFDRDVLPTRADFTNPGMRAAYGFMREWAQNDWMNSEELSGTKAVQWMVSRQCAGMDYSTNLTMQLRANDPDTDWRAAPIVAMDAQHSPVNFAGGSALIVPATSKHPREALDFMLWLTDVPAQRLKWSLDPGLGLALADVANQATPDNQLVASDPALNEDPLWKGVLNPVPPRTPGVSPVYSQIYQVLGDMQERVFRTQNDLDAELTDAQAKAQQLLDDNQSKMPELYVP